MPKTPSPLFSSLAPYRPRCASRTLPFALIATGFYAHMLWTTNFHPVIAGEVYRSSQPSASTIAELQKQYGIKTIINLRGNNTGHAWYDSEVAQAKELNIDHIDFRMSSAHELTQAQAAQLVEIMRDAPKPLLIHCQAGSDRTGLASALYLAAIAKTGEATAESQMSIIYGHLPFSFTRAYAMDRTFESWSRGSAFQTPEYRTFPVR